MPAVATMPETVFTPTEIVEQFASAKAAAARKSAADFAAVARDIYDGRKVDHARIEAALVAAGKTAEQLTALVEELGKREEMLAAYQGGLGVSVEFARLEAEQREAARKLKAAQDEARSVDARCHTERARLFAADAASQNAAVWLREHFHDAGVLMRERVLAVEAKRLRKALQAIDDELSLVTDTGHRTNIGTRLSWAVGAIQRLTKRGTPNNLSSAEHRQLPELREELAMLERAKSQRQAERERINARLAEIADEQQQISLSKCV